MFDRKIFLYSLIISMIFDPASQSSLEQESFNEDYLSNHAQIHSISKRSPLVNSLGILPEKYYSNVAPVQDGEPVLVKISVIILNLKIGSISTQVNAFFLIKLF